MNTLCKTVSGAYVDLVAPGWKSIPIDDVATGLALTNRFAGQTRAERPIAVAEHSLVVAALARPQARLPALLHDAHEAFTGDWTRPAIEALRELGGDGVRKALRRMRRGLDVAIARRVLEDCEAKTPHGTSLEAELLADEMAGPWVGHADDEALRLEEALRGDGSSPELARALELYGASARDPAALAREWLQAVRLAAWERYGGEGP